LPKPGPGQIAKGGLSKVTEPSLTEARRGFVVKPVQRLPAEKAAPEPPPNVFRLLRFDSPAGKLAAYLSPDPGDGRKHPAIIWITGGDCNSIDELWKNAPRENDQTAAAYRKAGIIMMFPSLRGGNDNPGQREGFFGEVDDVLAATDYPSAKTTSTPSAFTWAGTAPAAHWSCSWPSQPTASVLSFPSGR